MKESLAVFLCAFVIASPAWTWNNAGHKTVAYLAYSKLNQKARQRVDALLSHHPMYAEFTKDAAPGKGLSRIAFENFATWPDSIRGDKRFVDTPHMDAACRPVGSPKPAPGPVFPGFPDMQKHQDWHYDDIPFSTDGTPTHPSCAPNALTQINAILQDLASPSVPDDRKTFLLPWLLHLVGDVHQPLHAVSRFSKEDPDGDQGGNKVKVKSGSNLHSFWDQLPGTVDTAPVVAKLAATVRKKLKSADTLTPEQWLQDSAAVARDQVYSFTGAGSSADPAVLSEAYRTSARNIALTRMGQAGYRLAAVLNSALGELATR